MLENQREIDAQMANRDSDEGAQLEIVVEKLCIKTSASLKGKQMNERRSDRSLLKKGRLQVEVGKERRLR